MRASCRWRWGACLATGLSPEWQQQQRQRYYFVGFLAVCGLSGTLRRRCSEATAAASVARKSAEKVAQELLTKLNSQDFKAAYEHFPDDVRKNIGYAQFKRTSIGCGFNYRANR